MKASLRFGNKLQTLDPGSKSRCVIAVSESCQFHPALTVRCGFGRSCVNSVGVRLLELEDILHIFLYVYIECARKLGGVKFRFAGEKAS
jgi:hypothetical protein